MPYVDQQSESIENVRTSLMTKEKVKPRPIEKDNNMLNDTFW